MSDKPNFFFEQFVPGFDFLKNLASGAGAGAVPGAAAAKAGMPAMPGIPGVPGISNWIAPTLSVEEVDKRIQELKAVQFWLDQNLHALKATIQALEVQRMTLSTLQGMNLQMEDLAKAFTGSGGAAKPAAAKSAPAKDKASPKEAPAAEGDEAADAAPPSGATAAAAVDPLQLWGALTQQFRQIAATALQDAAQLKMPGMPTPASATKGDAPASAAARGASPASKKAPARKRASTPRRR